MDRFVADVEHLVSKSTVVSSLSHYAFEKNGKAEIVYTTHP
jgi:hypothetical protein